MTTRITGMNSGLDIDSLVKASMKPYRARVDKEVQNQKVLEYQQEQYKQIMSDASSFYDKYFDILKSGNMMSTATYNTVSFKSGDDTKVTAQGFAGADTSGYKVSVTELASKASVAIKTTDLTNGNTLSVDMGTGKTASVTVDTADMNKTISLLNADLQAKGINAVAKYTDFNGGGIVIESSALGLNQTVNVQKNGVAFASDSGTDLAGTITKDGGATYSLKGTSNTVTVDNVQFTLKGKIAVGSEVSLTGTTDVTALKDKIVGFVNDYNNLLKEINTKLYETRNKDYMPLTDEQKSEMTESQITAWEKKAQTGLLRKDSDLERIAREMKSAMSSVMSGSGLHLEKIGISPVKDYADKNGMLTVNESKLTAALQDNAANVKDLLTRAANTTTGDKGGVITQLAAVVKSEFKTSTSSLSKKAGLDGTTTQYDNTLYKSIAEKKKLINKLNSSLADKENALYKQYSALETALEKLNSQQSSLTSMLGQG